jgi:integrase
MKAKPRGRRHRNLYVRGGVICYERLVDGRRIRFSTRTADWDEAASVRDLYEARHAVGRRRESHAEPTTFAEFAARYLVEDTDHLAATTRSDRARMLKHDGVLLGYFGMMRLDEITAPAIRDYWSRHVLQADRKESAGKNDVDALGAVFGYALDLELVEQNPLDGFRRVLNRKRRSQRGRAESDVHRNIRPIEHPDEIRQLVEAAREEGLAPLVHVLLCLDAGLRDGEALGLRWGGVLWGEHEGDPRRAIVIEESRPRGGEVGPTKSGRSRRVQLSRRLRTALQELYREKWGPKFEEFVLPADRDPSVFRRVEWRRILKRAAIGHRRVKDLRDTFASQLLTAGVQLGYVSVQLGHADVGVTARHYARWAGGDGYRDPMRLEAGEVPADMLARLVGPPKSPHSESLERANPWWSLRESNPCLQGENLIS